jgi:hypothetical protein
VNAPVQYGPRLKATSLVLNVDYRIPLQKLSDLWQQWVGQAVNTATLLSAQAQIHQQLQPIETHIKEQIIAASVSHHDETGLRPGRPLGLLAGNIPRFGSLPVVNQRGLPYRAAEESDLCDDSGPSLFSCLRLG